MTWVLVAVLSGVGMLAFRRIRFPAPELTGPLVLLAVAALLGFQAPSFPYWLRLAMQVVIGAGTGYRVDASTLRGLRQMFVPAVLILAWTIGSTFGLGWLVGQVSHLGPATSTLSACPGGMIEMTVMALSFNADPPVVLVFQLVRFLGIILVMPLVIGWMRRRAGLQADARAIADAQVGAGREAANATSREDAAGAVRAGSVWPAVLGLAIALAGGVAGSALGLPAPGLIGALVAVAAARLAGLPVARPPRQVRDVAAAGLGAVVGVMFTPELALGMVRLAFPVAVLTVGLIVTSVALGLLIMKITGWDLTTCLYSTAPAGMSQMIFLADSYGCDPVQVSLLHLVRIITVVAAIPMLVGLLM